MAMLPAEPILRRSSYLSAFAHMGDVYLYHDLYGYIMKMSPDVLAFLDAFAEPIETATIIERYQDSFDGQSPKEFVDIFSQFACLLAPDDDEIDGIFYMVPVKSKWNVWTRSDDGELTLHTAWGERARARYTLTKDELAVWDAIDGERRLSEFRQDFDPGLMRKLLPKLTHHDIQAVKLTAFPMSTYKGRRNLRPPYLTSTMPYAPYRPGANGVPVDNPAVPDPGPNLSPKEYYQQAVADADAQFDHRETTLSHLLRVPHPALRGRTYGQALIDALGERELLPAPTDGAGEGPGLRVLEVGAGLGYVARDCLNRMRERGLSPTYHIVELAPALAEAQRARLAQAGFQAEIRVGDILEVELPEAGYDLILGNEMIGDLPAVELERHQVGFQMPADSSERLALLAKLGATGELIRESGLTFDDAPDPFYLTTGAIQLVRRAWRALAPGGVCVLTEFGELHTYPRLSTQLDHPELSIHFAHLSRAAEAVGFEVKFEFIIDLLDFERTLEGMATTRSYFRALREVLLERGVDVQKIGYTREMWDQLIADSVGPDTLGEIYFDKIEDRLMGLVPHEFKALILRKPGEH